MTHHLPQLSPAKGAAASESLRANCERCFALCCMATTLEKSAEFAIDKPANRACPNLRADFRCSIHSRLRQRGFAGCTEFECYGAGQKVSQHTFGGRDWRSEPDLLPLMSLVFRVQWQLHLSLHYLSKALEQLDDADLHSEVSAMISEITALTMAEPETLKEVDVLAHKQALHALLWKVSQSVRERSSESARLATAEPSG